MILYAFPVLAGALVYIALATHAYVVLWPATVMIAAWIVYLVGVPRAFGKRPDGSLPWYAWLAWGPLFLYQWIGHELVRRFTREPVASEVAPGVWVGRRPRAHELGSDIAMVVDLCAEMPAARGVHDGRTYLTIPTLDARAPTPRQIAEAVDQVVAAGGPALIHCAFGHGRSATVAAAVLVHRGDATLEDVEAKMRAIRPRIGLNAHQRAALAAATKLAT